MVKTCIYANEQLLAACDETRQNRPIHFYLHDRLGSVRQIITFNDSTSTVNVNQMYTYKPFGGLLEEDGSFDNSFMFAGQLYDSEIGQYYMRARQYDPYLCRFTSRDPVLGTFKHPLTLHKYLYCLNDPINNTDPSGEFSYAGFLMSTIIGSAMGSVQAAYTGNRWHIVGGAVGGAVSGGLGGFVWGSSSALWAKLMVGSLQGAVASGAGTAAQRTISRDFEGILADMAWSMSVGALLGGAGGGLDYAEYFDDVQQFEDAFALIGIDINAWITALRSEDWAD
jgi:RHS repeat-associated protein